MNRLISLLKSTFRRSTLNISKEENKFSKKTFRGSKLIFSNEEKKIARTVLRGSTLKITKGEKEVAKTTLPSSTLKVSNERKKVVKRTFQVSTLNISNEEKVALCESIIQYTFSDGLKGLEALQRSDDYLVWHSVSVHVPRNNKLALVGDVFTRAHLCKQWYATGLNIAQWTQIDQTLLTNANFDRVGCTTGLHACVILQPGVHDVCPGTMATTVEAILGAVYCDGGDAALAKVMTNLGLNPPTGGY